MSRLTMFVWILLLLIGCAADPQISAEITATPTQTPTPTLTQTPKPTRTPLPTWTVIATNTPLAETVVRPTASAEITLTSAPTTEKLEPSATPTVLPSVPAVELEPPPTATDAVVPLLPTAQIEQQVTPTETALPISPTAQIEQRATATETAMPTSLPEPTAPPVTPTPQAPQLTTIGEFANLPDGSEVTVTGNVVHTASFSHGFKFTIADATGRITLLLWHSVYDDCWACGGLNLGATVSATGEIGRFGGELQVEPNWGGGINVITPAYAWAQPQPINNLASVTGQRVMVEGTITDSFSNEEFAKLQLNDGSGTVEIFVWKSVWDRIPIRNQLTAGATMRVVGVVGEFRGTIQVQPMLPVDVVQ